VDTWRYQCWRLHTAVPAAVSVKTYRTTQAAVNSEELHCIVVWRKDRTIVNITSHSVPKGRTVNEITDINTAMLCLLLCVRQSPEYLQLNVGQSPEHLQLSVWQYPECLLMSDRQSPEFLLMSVRDRNAYWWMLSRIQNVYVW